MLIKIKHELIKIIEKIPLIEIFVYNNIQYFKFLFPHEKDYFALKILFPPNEKRAFIDVGGNIGLSTIGFRELGFKKNKIYIFEPDKDLIKKYLEKIKSKYNKLMIYPFGLSNKKSRKHLYKAYYKNFYFHFNNSFDKKYIHKKLKENYGNKSKKFLIKSQKLKLEIFDNLKIKDKICFIKIDVEGLDHLVLYGMKNCIKRFKPVILVEYNKSNFLKIYNFLNKHYDCYFFDYNNNLLKRLSKIKIQSLKNGKIIEEDYKKNSVNLFFLKK